ncbi:hypothetical protein B0A50_02004 [Salinomyces thailandicus]|uniref:Chalcone isomerase domain-containing protein n=1 Tax=Salinomyces thailandicus TaxID=706561 RepID=A0A4U0U9A6_9PEZI|nr:hypothetical protein B0A50_02004 [Salinomyces thailandica]
MSAPTRQAMRFLSPRLQHLGRPQPSTSVRQIRHASGRYSSPSKRTVTTSPPSSSLLGPEAATAAQVQHNPLDARAARLAWVEKRHYHMRRMRFAGMGLLLSIGGLAMVIYNLDLDDIQQAEEERKRKRTGGLQLEAPDEANAMFQGKEVHIIGAGEDKRIVAGQGSEEVDLVETGTSHVPHFPRVIFLPASSAGQATVGTASPNSQDNPGNLGNNEEYTLVGLGIRTVMWIQVYVVGMYVRTKDISTMQEKLIHNVNPTASTLIPSEKDGLRHKLLDPEQSRETWSELLKTPGIKTAWRMSPTRNTDFGHLRDGFVNGINKGKAEHRQLMGPGSAESEFDSEEFGSAVQQLRAIFTGGKALKQSILILARDEMGKLDVLYQPKPEGSKKAVMERLGSVGDERVGRLIWLGYLAGSKVSSPSAREGVVQGCVEFASRPVGSVETRVI